MSDENTLEIDTTVPENYANESVAPEFFANQEAPPDEQAIRVLMVEDNDYYFRFIRQLLRHCPEPRFELDRAARLSEASQYLTWNTPDVILLDLLLPDSDGIKTLTRIKQQSNGAPIVILTGSDDANIGLLSVSEGAQDYLVKQHISNDSLIRCIRYAIERRKSEESRLRLAAIKDFTAALAHDLQIPLIGANKLLDALLTGALGTLEKEQADVLNQLRESNSSQLKTVQKLLEIYRYESRAALSFENIHLDELIAGCIAELSLPAHERSTLVVNIPVDVPAIPGDRLALCRLFTNLLDNAIKFGTRGERVEVRAETQRDHLAVYVHNSGHMIPAEVQTSLFRNFFQGVPGKQYVTNTGLGLYLCHRIASLHQGRIILSSSSEAGTTFTVVLPTAKNYPLKPAV